MVSEHFDYPKRPTKSGTVLLAGRTMKTDNSNFGIVIFLLSSIEEARGIMNADASVASRVFRAELFPYRNVLMNIDSKRWEP